MAVVEEIIRVEADGTLSFGDYTLNQKTKKEGFEFQGDQYKVKTFAEITKLERNGMFVYESVPGTSVNCPSVYTAFFANAAFAPKASAVLQTTAPRTAANFLENLISTSPRLWYAARQWPCGQNRPPSFEGGNGEKFRLFVYFTLV